LHGEPPFFDDDQRPVLAVDPEVFADDPGPDDATRLRQQVLMRTVDFLARGCATPEQVGRRVLLLAHYLKCPSAPRSQRDLAKRLRVSEPAISRAVKIFKQKLQHFAE